MIEVKNLTKRYGQHFAVNDISFTVNEGEIVGFLGPNGAGKSTTMNIMTGFISFTDGSVTINGKDILDEPEEAKKNIGYLPDNPPLYNDMLVSEYLNFVCELKSVKKEKRNAMINEIMDMVKITDMKGRLLKNLSKGYRQRVGLAQALVGFPKIIILDEPMVGLDPKQILEIREVIKKLGKKHTIILSSHILADISAVCDRVMIINKGEIVAIDTPDNLGKKISSGHQIKIRVKGELNEIKQAIESINIVEKCKSLGSFESGTYDFNISGNVDIDVREAIFETLAKNKMPLYMMKSSDMSLEEIFIEITSGKGGHN